MHPRSNKPVSVRSSNQKLNHRIANCEWRATCNLVVAQAIGGSPNFCTRRLDLRMLRRRRSEGFS